MTPLATAIVQSNAHRAIRDSLANRVIAHPENFDELLALALNLSWPHHHKACWILELVLENHIAWLHPHLEDFTATLAHFQNSSALRSLSKICLFAVGQNQKEPGFLTNDQLHRIVEACFDWIINPDEKVANKAYAIRTLHIAGRKQAWIYPELIPILELGYTHHSAAYQAVVRDVLPKIR